MIFGFKNPVNRELSADDLLRAKKAGQAEGAFLGASLLTREACRLSLKPGSLTRVTGHLETYAPNVANLLAKEAIPERLSILLLDFQHTEEYWHRLWAAAFNLDRAKDFRLLDFDHEELSDYLGANLPAELALRPGAAFLRQTEQAFAVEPHLREKGVVATFAEKEHHDALWALGKSWLPAADLALIFGWDQLSIARRTEILQAHRRSGVQRMVVVQSDFATDALVLPQATEVLFEQKAEIPAELWKNVRAASGPDGLEKALAKVTPTLAPLSMIQCLVLQGGRLDLVQTGTGDGLPWPPDYKPLRLRFPGN